MAQDAANTTTATRSKRHGAGSRARSRLPDVFVSRQRRNSMKFIYSLKSRQVPRSREQKGYDCNRLSCVSARVYLKFNYGTQFGCLPQCQMKRDVCGNKIPQDTYGTNEKCACQPEMCLSILGNLLNGLPNSSVYIYTVHRSLPAIRKRR